MVIVIAKTNNLIGDARAACNTLSLSVLMGYSSK